MLKRRSVTAREASSVGLYTSEPKISRVVLLEARDRWGRQSTYLDRPESALDAQCLEGTHRSTFCGLYANLKSIQNQFYLVDPV